MRDGGPGVRLRPAGPGDEARLAEVAAATFALACPPHTTRESIAMFIRDVLSTERFAAYLADPARDLFLAEDLLAGDGTRLGDEPRLEDETGREGGAAQRTVAVGYAMLVTGEPSDEDVRAALTLRPTSELSKIYVLPGRHGGGVAKALMDACLDAARARGSLGAWLGVNQLNERAQRFYGKSGFTRVGTKRFLVGDRYEDDFVFERAL
jgi:ribosomal protein S18 acetylase RimI-like enzyme